MEKPKETSGKLGSSWVEVEGKSTPGQSLEGIESTQVERMLAEATSGEEDDSRPSPVLAPAVPSVKSEDEATKPQPYFPSSALSIGSLAESEPSPVLASAIPSVESEDEATKPQPYLPSSALSIGSLAEPEPSSVLASAVSSVKRKDEAEATKPQPYLPSSALSIGSLAEPEPSPVLASAVPSVKREDEAEATKPQPYLPSSALFIGSLAESEINPLPVTMPLSRSGQPYPPGPAPPVFQLGKTDPTCTNESVCKALCVLIPVAVCSHLAFFAIGCYLGRRSVVLVR